MARFESLALLIEDRADNLRRTVVLVAVAGVPLLFVRFTSDPFNIPKLALLLACVGVAGGLLAIESLQGFRTPAIEEMKLPVLAFIAPLVVATALSPYRWWALFGEHQRFQGLIPYLLAVALGILVAVTFRGDTTRLAYWFSVAGAIAGAYALAQYFGLDVFQWGLQFGGSVVVTSTLGNTEFSGAFLAITLPVSVALWMQNRSDMRPLGFASLILGGLIVCFSQGAQGAAIGGVAVLLGIVLSERRPLLRWLGLAVAAAMAVGGAGLVILGVVNPDAGPVAETVKLRSWWWEGAWEAGLDHPIVGHGPNSFAVDWWAHRPPDEASVQAFDTTNDPHSVYLSLFDGAGILGVGGLLFALGWFIRKGLRLGSGDVLGAGFLGGICAYAIQAVVGVDEIGLRVALWTCIGGLVASAATLPRKKGQGSKGRRRVASLHNPVAALAIAGAVVAVGGYGIVLMVADASARSGEDAFRRSDAASMRESMSSAITLRSDDAYRHSYAFYLGELGLARGRAGAELMAEAQEVYGYLDHHPDVPGLRDRGLVFAAYSEFDRDYLDLAADSYATAMAIDSYNISLIPEGADVLFRASRFEEIVDLLPPTIELLGPKSPSLWPILGLAYLETGDESAAQDALDQATSLLPDDPRTLELQEGLAEGNN